jgi:DNA transformation protein
MGNKGSTEKEASSAAAEGLKHKLSSLGDIRLRKMFGGYGVFEQDKMFALVDREGSIFFKADETIIHLYEEAGSSKHSRMPYYRLPKKLLADETKLNEWAQSSITVSRTTK